MSKSKLSMENQLTLAQNNAIDFTHACITIALHEVFGLGKARLDKVNARRNEVNSMVLEIMTRPASRRHEPLRKAEAWMRSQMPAGTAFDLNVPMAKGTATKRREMQMKIAVDQAATLEWRVYAIACAQVLGFGTDRLNRLHEEVLVNYRQLNEWVLTEGVDVAMEWFRRAAADAYKTDVQVLDVPEEAELEAYRQHTADVMQDMRARNIRAEVSRMRVPCTLPLAKEEVERRIQCVLQQRTCSVRQR